MSSTEITNKVDTLKEWLAILDDTKAQVEALKDEIKREMEARGVEHMEAGTNVIHYTTVTSSRFDTVAFRKANPRIYQQYTKETLSKRFTIG
ncbi:MAG: hypothetical protein LUC83_09630 [Clostridiales bacterium]|nr:hypothetical protein [Clostridiales bacterium]